MSTFIYFKKFDITVEANSSFANHYWMQSLQIKKVGIFKKNIKLIVIKMSKPSSLNLCKFTQQLIEARLWEERNLPRSQSRIAFDLMVFIAHCHYSKTPLTLKLLFNSLTHSERGIRYVLDQFLENEWCVYRTAFHDKRFRYIYPTDKFIDAFENYYQLHLTSLNRVNA